MSIFIVFAKPFENLDQFCDMVFPNSSHYIAVHGVHSLRRTQAGSAFDPQHVVKNTVDFNSITRENSSDSRWSEGFALFISDF